MGTNTGIGIGIGIPFKNNALGGDKPYFPPELKARMIGVWDNYGKKNTDADRNIIKNKIPNAGGDLEILNAAYEGMSGCNGYPVVFGANETWENLSSVYSYTSDVTSTTIHITRVKNAGVGLLFSYVKKDGALTNIREIPAFRVTVKGLEGNSKFGYRYLATEDATVETLVYLGNGTHELSKSFAPTEALLDLTRNAWVGIFITSMVEGEVVFDCDITIEVLPEYEGAFVTDGVNDMIISQKTIAEMGITDEVTIVSMIHQITLNSTYGNGFTNYIENLDKSTYVRNNIYKAGKTGIYGYSVSLINRTGSNINNILGDKNDYRFEVANRQNTLNASKLSIIGRATGFNEISSIAHYWTFAVLGKATADEINLIIAKYNLDRTLRPDILCNITKQGITNDNHADFNDKLIDYSGNGRDIQMYNLAWKGGSGVAAKQYETFKDWTSESSSTSIIKQIDEFTRIVESTTNGYWVSRIKRDYDLDKVYDPINVYLYQDNNFLVHECKYEVDGVKYVIPINEPVGKGYHKLEMYTKDRYTELPENAENVVLSEWYFPKSTKGSIKYSIIPSCKGGILLDGINDFGKVTGMPIYKDYTFIIEREFLNETFLNQVCLVSKSKVASEIENGGAFIVDNISVNSIINSYSFYKTTSLPGLNTFDRQIVFQSKYKYLDKDIAAGTSTNSDTLWLGTFRDNDQRFLNGTIYSLMSFPYSMSKFLIERQLKKHKLGTLYPNMVEFRPVIKANANYNIFYTALLPLTGDIWERINIGDYVPVGRRIAIQMSFDNEDSELVSAISSQLGNISITKNSNNKGYTIFGDILKNKSPQKINITIDEYIRYEDIVQPYPSFVKLENLDRTHTYTWGDKLKVGDIIRYNSSKNLLEGAYTLRGQMECNGVYIFDNNQQIVVTKEMVFAWSHSPIWNIDDNEPKCILSPRLLRIPNSSYKILGHIPDISGHGNHGKINNSAYAGMSGVNGYPVVFGANKTWANESNGYVTSITSNTIHITNVLNAGLALLYSYVKYNGNLQNIKEIPPFKIEIKGLEGRSKFIYKYLATSDATKETNLYLGNGTHELPKSFLPTEALINNAVVGFSISPIEEGVTNFLSDITIKVLPKYEGAYCLDGVDDFVTIPTTVGGKQVLMKVNWDKTIADAILYDQRGYPNEFAIYNADVDNNNNPVFAYQARNNGQTYIDGILNKNIKASELRAITHNITITNELSTGTNTSSPVIGSNRVGDAYFTKMALYDFMLFDNISTDDKIKELNEYVGIEAKVELPPYYWDAYGKTNLDVDRGIVPQLGIAKDYSFASFDNEMAWYLIPNDNYINVVSRNGYEITLKNLSTGVNGWRFQNSTVKGFISHDIPFRIKANKSIRVYWDMHSYKVSTGAEFGEVISITNVSPNKDTYINLRHLTEEELAKLDTNKDRMYYLLWFDLSTIAVNEEVVIEMLPVEGGRNLWLNNYNFAYDKK